MTSIFTWDTYKFSRHLECNGNTIETIPVDDNEKYSLSIDKRWGTDIEFEIDKDNR
jgi:hypothetical protein